MSRCFPFPPPGYEKKARPDDENLLAKEKHKEKKHKKDKKDREKREGKDKKDKERSEEKHREKKDRKEKHKDKKEKRKDKDRHKDKEKKKTSDETNTGRPPECRNGEKLGSNCMPTNDTTEFKFLFELGKRNRDDDRATENHMVQKITLTGQRRAELPGNVVESNTAILAEGSETFKDKRQEGNGKSQRQSSKAHERDMENGSAKYFTGDDQRKVEGVAGLVGNYFGKQTEEKEKNKHKHSDSKGDKHKDRDREKKSKSKDKKREKKEKEEKAKEKKPDKEQLKPRESGKDAEDVHSILPSHLLKESNKSSCSGIILGKRKEPEMNGFLHDNDIRPNKLPRPTSSSHQIMGNGSKTEPSKSATKSLPERKGNFNNLKVNGVNLPSPPVADNGKKMASCAAPRQFASDWQGTGNNHKVDNKVSPSPPVLENGRKLEPPQTATQLAELYVNHKLDNKVPFSHPVLENGRKLEPCQTATQLTSGRPGVVVNRKVDKKSQNRINGLTQAQEPNVCSTKPSPAPVRAKENVVEAPVKPPHPDSKYLSQILSVPNVEWSGFDDQEWLFGSNDNNAKKPRSGSSQVEMEMQVWAEALRVESADVTALPYVIPY